MTIPKFALFEHRLEEIYNENLRKLPEMIKALRLSNSLEEGDLNKIKKDVFDQLSGNWDFNEFDIKKSDISVQNQEFSFEKSIAADILGTHLTSSITSDFVTLYYAIYTIPYSGNIEAVKYTTIYPKEEIYMTDHGNYLALTIYSLFPVKESSEAIKHEKDRVLDMIDKNHEANKAYIKDKEGHLKDAIDKEIDFNFKSGRNEISDNNSLL
jgi:hypothetical protein